MGGHGLTSDEIALIEQSTYPGTFHHYVKLSRSSTALNKKARLIRESAGLSF
jgi:hypothetical protein